MANDKKKDTNSQEEMPSRSPGTRKGEEIIQEDGKEPGRRDKGQTGAGRPAGESDARDSTSINPQNPVDPESPKLPPA
ncbi:hypothetical protein L0152_14625 [bacterium]|nr:hypothetical protein [bacterium]